ncbi:MAG: chemotaxis protein CheX [Planctomycetes bacterium]|nr:chemotaxis protein CheX [Planctomycetota bacterium]
MPEIQNESLTESVCEALETMAFMIVEPPEEDLPTPTEGVKAKMDFMGPHGGTVELMAGFELIETMAANFMGIEPGDPEAQDKRVDAFKELLNVICGILLPKLASSPGDIFDITVPQAQLFTAPQEWETFTKQSGVTVMECDGFPLAFKVTAK